MLIGIPKEIKNNENRVALTPAGVQSLVGKGHEVLIETNAGLGSGFTDADYQKQGAKIVPTAAEAWAAELVVKVKEPLAAEYSFLRDDLLLFTYLHMAAAPELADAMTSAKTTGLAYETVRDQDGQLPLLVPFGTPGTPPRSTPDPPSRLVRKWAPIWTAIRPATSLIGTKSGILLPLT